MSLMYERKIQEFRLVERPQEEMGNLVRRYIDLNEDNNVDEGKQKLLRKQKVAMKSECEIPVFDHILLPQRSLQQFLSPGIIQTHLSNLSASSSDSHSSLTLLKASATVLFFPFWYSREKSYFASSLIHLCFMASMLDDIRNTQVGCYRCGL